MAAEMLAAYYGRECDSSEMFKPYKIAMHESYEKHLNIAQIKAPLFAAGLLTSWMDDAR